jgi:hypothetical protein
MNTHHCFATDPPSFRPRAWPVLVFFFLLAFVTETRASIPLSSCLDGVPPTATESPSDDVGLSTTPLLANWWDELWFQFWASLRSRKGMLQFGCVGMILALWIIWWRSK